MSFFHNALSVWKALRTARRPSPARGNKRPAPIEALEVRALLAGEFTELGTAIIDVDNGSVAWGDADNDGDLDVLVNGIDSAGVAQSKVYRNDGDNVFVDLNAGLTGVSFGSSAWGDADRDGDLDILLTGFDNSSTRITKVYRNNGSAAFTEIANTGLAAVGYSSVAWGDADRDGDLDIFLTGVNLSGTYRATLYKNGGNGTFTVIAQDPQIAGVAGPVAWGDYDNDGDLDLLRGGTTAPGYSNSVLTIFSNSGNGTLTLSKSFDGSDIGQVAWGDYDNDGDLDILATGRDQLGAKVTEVHRNDGSNNFTLISLTGVERSSSVWGDYDNDGKLDILITGRDSTNAQVAKIYRNAGNDVFTEITAGLTGVEASSSAWGDADNDGDLDLLITGFDGTNRITRLYRNNASSSNTPPAAPTGLTSNSAGGVLALSWTAPSDAETPSAGLSYNLRVGTTPGGSELFTTMADANGTRRLPDAGPIQGTSYTLRGLPLGVTTYYWSVQAIDTSFAGGAFAEEQISLFSNDGGSGITGVSRSASAWGDYDNDGDLDLLITGEESGGNRISRVYRNNGNDTFTDLAAGLEGVRDGSAAWADYDNDGDLDILFTGEDSMDTPITKIYRNDGNSTFTVRNLTFGPAGVQDGSVAWGDMDNDGDLDLLLTGLDSTLAPITRVYQNTPIGFIDVNAGLPGVDLSSVSWGDMDNDGDLDILLTGRDSTSTRIANVYRNDGNFTFTDLNASLTGVAYGSVAWGDMDNDGDLDILLTGYSSDTRIAKVYRNNGNSTFTDIDAGLPGVSFSSVSWGDMDSDGDLDILLTGNNLNLGNITRVYQNTGNGMFTEINAGLPGVAFGSVAWGDNDNDGDLDFLLTGRDGTSTPFAKVYRNNVRSSVASANTAPNVPTNLTATVPSSTSLTFNWTAATDNQTPTAGLSYNLRVGTTPGASNVFSTMANTADGTRRIADAGPIQGTSYTLKNLTPGTTYYWSVQAIDTAFAGSPFTVEQSQLLPAVNTVPTIGGAVANQAVNDTASISPFSTLTVTDPDTNPMSATITILNGVVRGDFTAGTVGWTRTVVGNDIRYSRTYASAVNIGATVQAAIRAFIFQPRTNAIKPNTTEATAFRVQVTDGIATPVANSATTVITTSVNNAPTIGSPSNSISVNDNATVNPFPNLTVSDVDLQEMLISVTILNGVVRGDFTNATVANGWAVRQVLGNNITYKRYFGPQANVGAAAQAAFRALVFQPRQNAINPGTTELTDFQVTVSDGVAPAVANIGTRVTTTSVNNAPTIGGAVANQTMNDNQTRAVFSTLTVTDPDTQNLLVRVTIDNGAARGDFTPTSSAGWARVVVGNNIQYSRYFNPAANIGAVAQAAIRVLVFQPRTNVPIGTTETTTFTVFVNDGLANTTNSTTSVITTGVAPRLAPSTSAAAALFLDSDIKTVIVPTVTKPKSNPLAGLLKRAR